MRKSAIWPVVVLAFLAGGCGKGTDGGVPPAEKQAAFPTDKVITNSIGMKLVRIPTGEFVMGSPEGEEDRDDDETQHRVRITKPFYLGMYEVTVGDFRQFVTDTGFKTDAEKDGEGGWGWNEAEGNFGRDPKYTWRNLGFTQTDRHPVANVSWNDAVAFCGWLSQKEGRTYRLPTEAEWEYACRAGTTTRFYHGDDLEGLAKVGNVADASLKPKWPSAVWAITSSDGYAFTSPVGGFRPNDFGLYDMHGNVWEWCSDWYEPTYYVKSPLNDPFGPITGHDRVLRGGGWDSRAQSLRSAVRNPLEPGYRVNDFGFRVAQVPAE